MTFPVKTMLFLKFPKLTLSKTSAKMLRVIGHMVHRQTRFMWICIGINLMGYLEHYVVIFNLVADTVSLQKLPKLQLNLICLNNMLPRFPSYQRQY